MAERKMCPSTTGDARDAEIIGFIRADGVVASITTPIPLTDEMRDAIGSRPEKKFRLAGKCVESKCGNWQDQACALIGRLRQQLDPLRTEDRLSDKLQRCAIRSTCVWWAQSGPDACRICPFVIYNPSE
jgi:hypothetical protein